MAERMVASGGVYVVVGSFFTFNVLNKLLFAFFPPPEKFRNQKKKAWLWRNIATSWVHALITAVLSIYCFWEKPSMLEDMIHTWNSLSYYTLALSTGYFVYDFVNLLMNDRERSFCIFIHHIVVVSAFLIALFNQKYIPFGLVSLLMEVNSVFLHSRRLMRMSGVDPVGLLYKINGILLIITFVIFRLVTCGWMFNFLVINRHAIPTLHFIIGTSGMCVLTPQNIFLLKQVWQSDSKHPMESQREKEKEIEKERHVTANSMTKLQRFLQVTIARGSE